jgi:GMP synthase (glutamine-hydrolysing)
MHWLAAALLKSIPVLGICFGHQLLAELAGGRVGNHPQGLEIGTCAIETTEAAVADPLFGNLPNRFLANTVHYQSVLQLPATAQVMAFNDHDPHHAYRIDNNVWGVQFHPEFDRFVMRGYINAVAARGQSVGSADTAKTPHAESLLRHFVSFCLPVRDKLRRY